jgi:hypothetical protein
MSLEIFFSSSTSFLLKDFELKLNEKVMNLKVIKLIILTILGLLETNDHLNVTKSKPL